jgi:hypothetical protein
MTHMTSVKQILRYLQFTLGVGFKIDKCSATLVSEFSDAD